MQKVRVGIVGCGWFGNKHLDYLKTRRDVEVVALATGNTEKLHATGKKVPQASLYADYTQLLEQQPVDALVICVPPSRHGQMEIEAAAKGIHLYVEKPLGIHLDEAVAAEKAIRKSGILCSVGYQQRYAHGIDYARTLLEKQKIRLLQGRWIGSLPGAPWWRDKALSGGQIVEQCTHIVDLMRYFAGEADWVFAAARQEADCAAAGKTVDDFSTAVIQFGNGPLADLATGCFVDPAKASPDIGLRLYGDDLRVELCWENGIRTVCREQIQSFPDTQDNHARAMAAFIEAVKQDNPAPIRSSYTDALHTFRLTLALERSVVSGQPVRLAELA